MNRLTKTLALAVTVLAAGLLAAGCGQGGSVRSAISSLAPSRSGSFSPPALSPGTGAPEPTTAPATSQPATSAPAVAPAPAQTSQSQAAPAPSPAASGSSLLWLWIVLGVLAVGLVAVLIARRSSRRSAAAAGWRSQVVDAYAQGSALYDMMSIAEAPGGRAANGDASARWADIQRRTGDLTQALYALRETAPDEMQRARVADVLASLQAVRSAMDAERAQGGAGAPPGARVHDLLLSFEASLRALRSPGGYAPDPGQGPPGLSGGPPA
jgi:hypothetical protein